MSPRLRALLTRARDALQSQTAAVLGVTVSVQGLVVGGQLLAATVVSPQDLGQVRWLESAFAIALLAASFGMPSIAFREAALAPDAAARAALLFRSTAISTAAGLVVGLACAGLAWTGRGAGASSWMLLLLMAPALLPANAARIGVAVLLGSGLAPRKALALLNFSIVAVGLLALAAAWQGLAGWIAVRFALEAALAVLLFRALLAGSPWREGALWPEWSAAKALVRVGLSANFGFVLRVLSDNLPMLLLRAVSTGPAELGWYGLASLLLYAPVLLLSVTMQARLPALIRSAEDPQALGAATGLAMRTLLKVSIPCGAAMLAVAGAMHQGIVLPSYAQAAVPLALLTATLPARAVVLAVGGVAVARGWFVRSSILALLEMGVVVTASLARGISAADMALIVVGAQFAAVVPALWLLRAALRPPAH